MSMAALALDDDYCNSVADALKRDPRPAKVIALRIGATPRAVENWRDGLNEPRGRMFFKLAKEIPELKKIALRWLEADNGDSGEDPQRLAQEIAQFIIERGKKPQ